MKKKWFFKIYIYISLILAVVASFFFIRYNPYTSLWSVSQSVFLEGRIYGVEEMEGDIRLFSSDASGKDAEIYSLDNLENSIQKRYHATELTMERPGIFEIVLEVTEAQTGNVTEIIQYNFDSKKNLGTVKKEIPLEEPSPYFLSRKIDDTFWHVDRDGGVWTEKAGELLLIFANDGTWMDEGNTAYTFGLEGLYFYNVEEDSCYKIPYDTRRLEKNEEVPFDRKLSSYGKVTSLRQMEDGTWIASFLQDDFNTLPMVLGHGFVLEQLYLPLWQEIICFIVFAVSFFCIISLVFLLKKMFQTIFPTVLRIVCVVVPALFLGGVILYGQMWGFSAKEIETRTETKIFYLAEALDESLDKDVLKENSWFENEVYLSQIFKKIYGIKNEAQVSPWNTYTEVYQYKNGKLHLLKKNGLYCTPIEFTFFSKQRENIVLCMEKNMPVLVNDEDLFEDNTLGLYYPILDKEENAIGVIFIGYPKDFIVDTITEGQRELFSKSMLCLVVLFGFLILFIFLLLRPLRKLKKVPESSIVLGEKGAFHGGSEIMAMISVYRQTAFNIKEHLRRVESLKKAYEPFVPKELTILFDKEDVRQFRPGDTVNKDAAVLIIEAVNFQEAASHAPSQALFSYMDKTLKEMMTQAELFRGILIQYTNAGMILLFEGGTSEALQAALSIQEKQKILPQTLGGERIIIGASIVWRKIRLEVIGNEDRMDIAGVSSENELARFLQKLSGKYQCGIFMDENTINTIPGLRNSKTVRVWGEVSPVRGENEKYLVYEIFSGQSAETAYLKSLTKAVFEKGVYAFQAGNFEEAREYFIEVLKKNKEDYTADRYFTLCTQKLAKKDTEKKGWSAFEYFR